MERDFANGYLFAEILHRYFPGEVSMHSFDKNASSVHKKRDNWSVLLKPLKKAGFDVATREWEAICAAEDGAAVEFVGKMHRRLAGGATIAGGEREGTRRTSASVTTVFRDAEAGRVKSPRAAEAMTAARPGAAETRPAASSAAAGGDGDTKKTRLATTRIFRAEELERPPRSSGSSRARAAGSTGRRTSVST